MSSFRAIETDEQAADRRSVDRACKAKKRALETEEEAFERKSHDRACKGKKRDLETEEEASERKSHDRACKGKKRALETEEEAFERKSHDRACKDKKRALETDEEAFERKSHDRARKGKKKALETKEEAFERKSHDRACKGKKRALETEEEAFERKSHDRACKGKKRALETEEEAFERKSHDRACKGKKRALESVEETEQRRKKSRLTMTAKRASKISVERAIDAFISKTKQGPDYVCTSCHRLMYKQTVVRLNRQKYTKASNSMLSDVFSDDYLRTSVDDNHWICKTCDAALSRGRMPVQAKANGLRLGTVPSELSCLKPLEMRLISLRVPFMKTVALPSGKQRCIHGPAVNVPSKLDSICTMLPRLPSQSELIPLKLKRKLAYKGHYMYDYVTPENVLNALRWLKAHNPLYANVEINEEWAQNAESNDTDLYAGLVNCTVRIDSSDTESEPMQVDDSARLSEDTVDNSNTTTSSQLSNDVSCDSWPVNLVPALNNLRAFATD